MEINKNTLPNIIPDFHSKCGEVYLSTNGNLLFHCHLCDENFENFKYFFHLSDEHIIQHKKEQIKEEEVIQPINVSATVSDAKQYTNKIVSNSSKKIQKLNNKSSTNILKPNKSSPSETVTVSKNLKTENIIEDSTIIVTKTESQDIKKDQNKFNDDSDPIPYYPVYDPNTIQEIINFIKDKPIFYTKYPNVSTRVKLLAAKPLAEKLNKTTKQVLSHIQDMTTKYYQLKKLIEQNPNGDQPNWIWYNELKFIDNPTNTKQEIKQNKGKKSISKKKNNIENHDLNLNIENNLAFQIQEYKNRSITTDDENNIENINNEKDNINKPSTSNDENSNKNIQKKKSIKMETHNNIEKLNKSDNIITIQNAKTSEKLKKIYLDINLPANNKNKILNCYKMGKEIKNIDAVNNKNIKDIINKPSTSCNSNILKKIIDNSKLLKVNLNKDIDKEQFNICESNKNIENYKNNIKVLINYLSVYPHVWNHIKENFVKSPIIKTFAKKNKTSENELYNTLKYVKEQYEQHKLTNNIEKWIWFKHCKTFDEQSDNIDIIKYPTITINDENIETNSITSEDEICPIQNNSFNEYDPLDISIDHNKLKEIEEQKRKNLVMEYCKDWTEEESETIDEENANIDSKNVSTKNINNNIQRITHHGFIEKVEKIREKENLKNKTIKTPICHQQFIEKIINFIKCKSISWNSILNSHSSKIITLLKPLTIELNTSAKTIQDTISLIKEKYDQEKIKQLTQLSNYNKWSWFETCKLIDFDLNKIKSELVSSPQQTQSSTSSKQKRKIEIQKNKVKKCEHNFIKHGSKFLKCDICEKFFMLDTAHQGKFKRYKEILPVSKKIFECKICSTKFQSKENLEEHSKLCNDPLNISEKNTHSSNNKKRKLTN